MGVAVAVHSEQSLVPVVIDVYAPARRTVTVWRPCPNRGLAAVAGERCDRCGELGLLSVGRIIDDDMWLHIAT